MRYLLAVLAAVFLSACAVNPRTADDVAVRSYVRALGETRCSGIVVQPGLVLTASHCLPEDQLTLSPSGSKPVVLADGDDRLDYALLQFPVAEAPCPCAPIADRDAEPDEPVTVIGFPIGILTQIVTYGTSQGVQGNPNMPFGRRLVTTAPVAGGNSGGGVFAYRDGEYRLVGLLVEAKAHISFAVPLADLRPFLGRYMRLS